jgi:hypothetical protein
MKHQLNISIKTLEIPNAESIPEELTVIFESKSMDKDEAIARTLIACGQGWLEMKQGVENNIIDGSFKTGLEE